MNSMDVVNGRSAEDMLSEFAGQAERLREQICHIRSQQIDRILKLFDECRRVDVSLTKQTAELKSHVERIQRQIDQLNRGRRQGRQAEADGIESIAPGEHAHSATERPLSKMLRKLLTGPDTQDGRVLQNFTPNAPIGRQSTQKPRAGGSEAAKGAGNQSGPLDREEISRVAELARRLASYQDLPARQPCIRRHERIS